MFTTRKKTWSIFKPNLDAASILYNRLRVDTESCSLLHSSAKEGAGNPAGQRMEEGNARLYTAQ